ncbi:MAG: hypothetical protein KAJ19_29365, partial [Gammaproteobacteria bacterium]|nr:hypothetical protein [Gammaproteobacteria bacterium]
VIVELVEGILVKGRVIDARTRQPHSDWVNLRAKMHGTKFSLVTSTRYDGIWEMYLVPGEYELEYYGRGLKGKDIPRIITVKPGEILDCGVHRVNAQMD